jgi:hypothetical protein
MGMSIEEAIAKCFDPVASRHLVDHIERVATVKLRDEFRHGCNIGSFPKRERDEESTSRPIGGGATRRVKERVGSIAKDMGQICASNPEAYERLDSRRV